MKTEHATSGQVLAEGKTKIVLPKGTDRVIIVSKDDITAGDGARHNVVPGKGEWSTHTTSLAFYVLKIAGIPSSYISRRSPTEFEAYRCEMFPYEVVVRRFAYGSYRKRHPQIFEGFRFDTLVVEFYLKTSGKLFRGVRLEKDDPLITSINNDGLIVVRPDIRKGSVDEKTQYISSSLLYEEKGAQMHPFKEIENLARRAFLALELLWKRQDCTLVDLKIECGLTDAGKLVIADVIDADSWRLLSPIGRHLDKQPYREGASLEAVGDIYREVAERTNRFGELMNTGNDLRWILSDLYTQDLLGIDVSNSPSFSLS